MNNREPEVRATVARPLARSVAAGLVCLTAACWIAPASANVVTEWNAIALGCITRGGPANGLGGDGRLSPDGPGDGPPDRLAYDPDDPVPTLAGQIQPLSLAGPGDRRPVAVTLHASSPAPDTRGDAPQGVQTLPL